MADNLEEIEEEYRVLRELSGHPNLPAFRGLYLLRAACREDDQLWFVMEVRNNGHPHLVRGSEGSAGRVRSAFRRSLLRAHTTALWWSGAGLGGARAAKLGTFTRETQVISER